MTRRRRAHDDFGRIIGLHRLVASTPKSVSRSLEDLQHRPSHEMPNRPLFDIEGIDLDHVEYPLDAILEANPQRYEFQQLDHVCHLDIERQRIVTVRDLREDDFWVRGHMPGQPIFPGVLMLEAAAQTCAFITSKLVDTPGIYGFGGADTVRFRKMLTIGDRVAFLAQAENVTPRRSRYKTQGMSSGEVIFEATIFGIALPGTAS